MGHTGSFVCGSPLLGERVLSYSLLFSDPLKYQGDLSLDRQYHVSSVGHRCLWGSIQPKTYCMLFWNKVANTGFTSNAQECSSALDVVLSYQGCYSLYQNHIFSFFTAFGLTALFFLRDIIH